MIDWNNNGQIDPEEFFLTEMILGSDEEEGSDYDAPEISNSSGCLLCLLTLPLSIIMEVLHP